MPQPPDAADQEPDPLDIDPDELSESDLEARREARLSDYLYESSIDNER